VSVTESIPPDVKVKIFQALADASRLAVLEALRSGAKSVSELVLATGLSQPNVSGHLAVLRERDLVNREQRGRFAYYSLSRHGDSLLLAVDSVALDGKHVVRAT
jgi:DNA-binding transcriptional ArsR family regulator